MKITIERGDSTIEVFEGEAAEHLRTGIITVWEEFKKREEEKTRVFDELLKVLKSS